MSRLDLLKTSSLYMRMTSTFKDQLQVAADIENKRMTEYVSDLIKMDIARQERELFNDKIMECLSEQDHEFDD